MLNSADAEIRDIFKTTKTIAVVGYSANPARPSHYVAAFLKAKGYRVIPVNPGLAGQVHLGETAYADLASVPRDIAVEMVDIFRRSGDVPPVVEQALAELPCLRTVWMQMGIRNEAAAEKVRARGLRVVQDRCPLVEMPRLGL